MHKQALLLAAAVGARVASAEFFLITESMPAFPTPTINVDDAEEVRKRQRFSYIMTDIQQLASVVASLKSEASKIETKYQSLLGHKSAIEAKIDEFAATATTWGIPPEATDATKQATFTTIPAWFTALPEDVQSYKKAEGSAALAIASEYISAVTGGAQTTGGANATIKFDPSPSPSKTDGIQPSVEPSSAANAKSVGVSAGLLAIVGAGFALL